MLANLEEAKVIPQTTVGELSRQFRKTVKLGFLLALRGSVSVVQSLQATLGNGLL